MTKTMLDGYPDDPWFRDGAEEIKRLISEVETAKRPHPQIGRSALRGIIFERDLLAEEPEIFKNDPYNRIRRLNLN